MADTFEMELHTVPETPPQTTSLLIPAHPLVGREEIMSRLFQDFASDTDHDRKLSHRLSEAYAWQDIRATRNANTVDHIVNSFLAAAVQSGIVAEQSPEDPVSTSTADMPKAAVGTADAGVAVSAQTVATSLGNLATAMVGIIQATGGVVTAQSLAALLATVVSAAGTSAGKA